MIDALQQRYLHQLPLADGREHHIAKPGRAFVNLFGYEHTYRAHGTQSFGASDCPCHHLMA